VLRDLIKPIIELDCTLAVTHNEWFNDKIVMAYIKHFNKHIELIGEFKLLILDGHDNYATF
jgi:hypothetical protein